jgi:hypothetical protein
MAGLLRGSRSAQASETDGHRQSMPWLGFGPTAFDSGRRYVERSGLRESQ